MGGEYRLPESMRRMLSKPLGLLYTASEIGSEKFVRELMEPPMVITVGDRVTETVGRAGRVPDVQVVDGLENRKARPPPDVHFVRLVKVKNPAGTITEDAINGLKDAFVGSKPVRVAVDGEEDLLAIPAIALAPLSAVLYYGQPGEGMVSVRVGSDTKARNRSILAQMGISELR